jgi:hypothetical protein
MSYTYRRLFTGDSPETIGECFADLYRAQFEGERYVALRCRAWAIGRPLSTRERLRRWYESKEDPAQLWLPFEEFIPAKVTLIDTIGMGSGYTVVCRLENGSRYRGLYHLHRPNNSPDSIVAMETYKRVRMRTPEESVGPFQTLSRNLSPRLHARSNEYTERASCPPLNWIVQPSAWVVPSEIPSELSELLGRTWVRPVIETEVGRAIGINPLELEPETGLLYNENEEVEAQVTECTERTFHGPGNEYVFRVRLDPRTGEDYMILVREPIHRRDYATLHGYSRTPNSLLAS